MTPAGIERAKRICILGVPVDCLTMDETMERLEAFASSGEPHLIATADASGIAQAMDDQELKDIYESAALVTPDSQGVLWAAAKQGVRLTERVSGVDILERTCALSARKGYRIYFLGAAPGVAEAAAANLRLKYPGCNIVGTHDGYFKPSQDLEIAAEVAAAEPQFLFVAMGIPRQEKFIRATSHVIGAGVGIGVGGSLDVFSGRVKRAPMVIRKLKLEWLWRTLANPKKYRKAMMLPKFALGVLREGKGNP